ncbi:ABC transporter ATP-binding protein [Pelotomaculum propionicicum]|uniref:Putative HMP/thiamine import ATP-binding protein YkoD n=1 Tax=Pelotomaculum propionicicum TaxID=258475 RepID=A0A4Y7RJM3_9FIRM|nr:energy-coupling factor transporter ATPase [Pelotomaculum propionicicum]TEB09016.1 putative HMP/thiamine import ATP-binding protein YkoD [Pelotomaculum propionicicum]
MSIIQAKGLNYRYKQDGEWAVYNVDLTVENGEIIGLVGSSGCGKSTTAYILSGIIPHYYKYGEIQGSLFIEGRNSLAQDGDFSGSVGIVMQNPDAQLFGFSVEDTIAFGLENIRLGRQEMVQRVNRVIEELNIEHLRTRFTGELSGGQKQVACIASVLALDPKVLILDEPVSSLDPGGRMLVQQTVRRLKELGRTVLVIDHNLEWIAPLLDRVVVMEKGSVIFDGPTAAFLGNSEVIERSGVTPPQVTELYYLLRSTMGELPIFISYQDTRDFLNKKGLLKPGGRQKINPGNGDSAKNQQPAAGPASVTVSNLYHFYGRTAAVSEVNAAFYPGRVTAVVGQNGSGKSTLVKHFNGLLKPTRGTLEVAGLSPASTSIAQMARRVGMVFQNPEQMLFEETVEKEALFGIQAVFGSVSEENRARVLDLLEQFSLREAAEEAPFNLAAGQKQSLAIVSALAVDPEVLILDEPTLGFDRKRKSELVSLIHKLRADGRTVILISHDLSLVAEVADDVLVMNQSRVRAFGPLREVFAMQELFEEIGIPLPQVVRLGLECGCNGVLNLKELISLMDLSNYVQG